MLKRYRIRDYDFKLVIMLIAISVIGILAIGSAEESVQDKQIMGLVMGVFLMIIISLFDYTALLNLYWLFYILNVALLLLVELMGSKAGGAQRWFSILGIRFQPSELAKILLILFYAQYIMKQKEKLNSFRTLATMTALFLPPLFLIYNQPDLSTSIMLTIIFCIILFIGGLDYRIIAGVLAVVIPSVVIFLMIVLQPEQKLIKDYQQTRILAWLHPSEYVNTEGYQQANSITAIGSGQLWGKGLNNNIIGSVKNGNFISEAQTDFIFAVVGEEWGFLGSCLIIILEFLIALECALIGWKARDMAGHIIAGGTAALVCFQSFINIGVATGLIPNTGLPLPFVSYGLTSLVSMYLGMGFVLNVRWVSRRTRND